MNSKPNIIKKTKRKKGKTINIFDQESISASIQPRQSQPPLMDPKLGAASAISTQVVPDNKVSMPPGLPGAHLQGMGHAMPPAPLTSLPPRPPAGYNADFPGGMALPGAQLSGQPNFSIELIQQAQQMAVDLLPEQMSQKFSAIMDQAMQNPSKFDSAKASAEIMAMINPKDDFVFQDYTQPEEMGIEDSGLTEYDHRLMQMMEHKLEEEVKRDMDQAQKTQQICRFYLNGACKFGKACKFFHPSEDDNIADKLEFRDDRDCNICYEKVLARDRQFGLLTGCNHAFCLECIRKWRGQVNYKAHLKDQYRLCPICRRESYVVIPSSKYLQGKEKDDLMATYKKRLSDIPCKHFNHGKGKCPFLNSCFYGHFTSEGKRFEYPFSTPEFSMRSEEWNEDYEAEQTLANMIGDI